MRRSKFNVGSDKERRTYNGIVFDSCLEMKYYRDVVCPLIENGDVVECELQKPYELQQGFMHDGRTVRPITYLADFYLKYNDGSEVVIDTKGVPDTTAIIKRKIFWYKYPDLDYRWITYIKKYGGWISYDEAQDYRARERKLKEEKKGNKRNETKS